MDVHGEMLELLGAWALDACDDSETATVEAHLQGCATCSAEARRLRSAAGWLGVESVRPAPPSLRRSVLATARARRPPRRSTTLIGAYAHQVALLDQLLSTVAPQEWHRPLPRHDTLGGVVAHLAGNDAMLAADLGLRVVAVPGEAGPRTRGAWQQQTEILLSGLDDEIDLDRPVRLASPRGAPVRPLREALVQRAFETWTHLDDIGGALGRSQPVPPAEQVRRIVDLAVTLLPEALRANGVSLPGRTARLLLAGSGGGEWSFPLGPPQASGGAVAVTVEADAVEFARLVANRHSPGGLRHSATGDEALVARVLHVAALLGCD